MTDTALPPLRVRPRVWIGLAIWLAYVVIVFIVGRLSGVPYTEFGRDGGTLFLGAGLSLIVGTIFLAVTATLLGWWRPALFDRRHGPRWTLFVPALMVVALLINLASTDWGSYDGGFFAASIVLLLVGFTEEMATRGLLIVGLRSRLSELWVWFISSALFALMHLVNALGGQDIGTTMTQVGMAFLGGTTFYILRRATGTLIWAMVLHGFWDFSTFAVGHGTAGPLAALSLPVTLLAGIAGLAVVAFVIRGANERLTAPND